MQHKQNTLKKGRRKCLISWNSSDLSPDSTCLMANHYQFFLYNSFEAYQPALFSLNSLIYSRTLKARGWQTHLISDSSFFWGGWENIMLESCKNKVAFFVLKKKKKIVENDFDAMIIRKRKIKDLIVSNLWLSGIYCGNYRDSSNSFKLYSPLAFSIVCWQ